MKISKEIVCPSAGTDCPYCVYGYCQMKAETGDHPRYECDEYSCLADEDEEEDEDDEA
jgi:hypothetical protein